METGYKCYIILEWLQNINDGLPTTNFIPQYLQICKGQERSSNPEIRSLMLYWLSYSGLT